MRTLMSPRRRMPSGKTFLDPPKRRQAMAFLMSVMRRGGRGSVLSFHRVGIRRLTPISKDTRRDTTRKALVEVLSPGHGAKLLLLFGGKIARATSSAIGIEFEAEDAKVRSAKSDGRVALGLARLEGRVDSCSDDASAGDDFAGEVAVRGIRSARDSVERDGRKLTGRR